MSNHSEAFDLWIRSSFMELNTELENLYFAQDDRSDVSRSGQKLKQQLRDEGHVHVVALLAEGDTGDGFTNAFGVLGNVGLYLAALRRHELTNPSREEKSPFRASSLAMHLGVRRHGTPFFHRFIAHLNFRACGRAMPSRHFRMKSCSSTSTRGILLLQLAADALTKVVPPGISSDRRRQVRGREIRTAGRGRIQRPAVRQTLVERFFFPCAHITSHGVGWFEYRSANAGDFSGINESDLLLGLHAVRTTRYGTKLQIDGCSLPPSDQKRLRGVCAT
jgi:hypothetical protein